MAKNDRLRLLTHIRAMIGCGTFREGDKLPSLRALAGQFDMTMSTARNAMLELERAGLISMRQGDGNYVNGGKLGKSKPPKWQIAIFTDGTTSLEPTHSYSAHALLGIQERAAECDCRIEIFFSEFYSRTEPLTIDKNEVAGKDALIFLSLYDKNPLAFPAGIPAVGLLMGEMYGGRMSTVGLDCFITARLARQYFGSLGIDRIKCLYFDFGFPRDMFHVVKAEFSEAGGCEGLTLADNHPPLEWFDDPSCGYLIVGGSISNITQQSYRKKYGRAMTDDFRLLSIDGKSRYLPDFEPVPNIGIDWRQAGRTLLDEAIFRITNPAVPGRRLSMLPDLQIPS